MSAPLPIDNEEAAKKKKRSNYFGFACKRSFDLEKQNQDGTLTLDNLLDLSGENNGRLALKLFLKHLKGESLQRFVALLSEHAEEIRAIKAVASATGNTALVAKLKMIIVFMGNGSESAP
jgi:uncharacterized protein YdgA (DUF945 family)